MLSSLIKLESLIIFHSIQLQDHVPSFLRSLTHCASGSARLTSTLRHRQSGFHDIGRV